MNLALARGRAFALAFALVMSSCLLGSSCGGDTLSVELRRVQPAADPDCGAPQDTITFQVTALGDFPASEVTTIGGPLSDGATVSLSQLPLDTRVLRVSVFGDVGPRVIGKTAPFDFEELDDGDELSVFMTPPEGMCPTGPPTRARTRPILARAGAGVLVAGGVDSAGAPVAAVELYDPATGGFEVIAESLYTAPGDGLVGATATAVAAGRGSGPRVVIAGGASSGYQVYDAAARQLSPEFLLAPGRIHHAALALDDSSVLLAGGCEPAGDPRDPCSPGQLHATTTIIDLQEGRALPGPPLMVPRQGGVLVRDSAETALYVGGVDDAGQPVTDIERIVIDGSRTGEVIAAGIPAGVALPLASGGVLAGLAPSQSAPSAGFVEIPPKGGQAIAVADAPSPRQGATIAQLQNGRALVIGGEASGEVMVYEPAGDRFRLLPITLDIADAGAAALDDGTVLVLGGRDGQGARAEAWIVRSDLIGPYSSGIDLTFGSEGAEIFQQWIPSNPAQVTIEPETADELAHAVITSSGVGGALPSDWAVIAGPRFSRVGIRVRARSVGGGLAIMTGFRGPDDYVALILLPGQDATLFALTAGELERLECAAQTVTTAALLERDDSAVIEVTLGDRSLSAAIDGSNVIECRDLTDLPVGLVGVGAVGSAGEAIRIDSIIVSR